MGSEFSHAATTRPASDPEALRERRSAQRWIGTSDAQKLSLQ
jgi:hypothetical protein